VTNCTRFGGRIPTPSGSEIYCSDFKEGLAIRDWVKVLGISFTARVGHEREISASSRNLVGDL